VKVAMNAATRRGLSGDGKGSGRGSGGLVARKVARERFEVWSGKLDAGGGRGGETVGLACGQARRVLRGCTECAVVLGVRAGIVVV
jgi:hypothetical protein